MNETLITAIPTASTQQQRIIKKLKRELGPVIMASLNDPNVTDINANPDGSVWVERLVQVSRCAAD